jgi:hypothetical protein
MRQRCRQLANCGPTVHVRERGQVVRRILSAPAVLVQQAAAEAKHEGTANRSEHQRVGLLSRSLAARVDDGWPGPVRHGRARSQLERDKRGQAGHDGVSDD